MAFFDNLKKKYTELLNPVKKSLSDDSGWFRQGQFTPIKQVQDIRQQQAQMPITTFGPLVVPNFRNQQVQEQFKPLTQPFQKFGNQALLAGQTALSVPLQAAGVNYGPNPNLIKKVQNAGMLSQQGKIGGKELWKTGVNTADVMLKTTGLANPALLTKSAITGGGLNTAANVYQNWRQGQPILQNTNQAFQQGMVTGMANAGTTRLTSSLVGHLAKTIPALKPLTDTALSKAGPVATDTFKTAVTKWLNVAGKKLFKGAVIETLVETPIWATLTQGDKEKFTDAILREAQENFKMNVFFAGVDSALDARVLAPIVKKSLDDAVTSYFKNASSPESIAKQGGYIDMLGIIRDGTARTRDFDNARDILESNDPKITAEQKVEAQNTIDQLGRQMFSKRKYRELTTGINKAPENLIRAVADKIESDIKTNKGYEDIPNLALKRQMGVIRVGEDEAFPQEPRQPIKTMEGVSTKALPQTQVAKPVQTSIKPQAKPKLKVQTPNQPPSKLPPQDIDSSQGNIPQERGFITTAKKAPITAKPVKAKIEGTYTPITNKETVAQAQKIVSKDYDSAKTRVYNEPLTAETNTIAQELVKKAQKEGRFDEAIDIIETMAKKGTESGQAIQAFSIWNRLTPEGMLKFAEREIRKSNEKAGTLTKIFKKGDNKLSKDTAKFISEQMAKAQKMADGAQKDALVRGVLQKINDEIPIGASELFDAYRYQNLLSSPRTQMRNAYQNAYQALVNKPATMAAEAGVDWINSALRGKDRTTYLKDIPTYYKGLWNSRVDAVNGFMEIWKGKQDFTNLDIKDLRNRNLPKGLTVVSRAMEGADKYFQALIGGGEYAVAKKQGLSDVDAKAKAQKAADYYLLRNAPDPKNKTGQGAVLTAIDNATVGVSELGRRIPALRWFVPFVRTPMNAAKQWIEYSPAGILTSIGATNKKQQLAKAMIGSAVVGMGANLALQDRTTWSAPTDKKEKELFYASGKKPYSVRIGDKWVPMVYLGPHALALAIPAAVKQYQKDSRTALTDTQVEKLTQATTNLLKFFSEQTFLSGLGNFVRAISGDADYTYAGTLAGAAGQTIPLSSLSRYVATIVDPVFRKTGGKTMTQQFVNKMKTQIPFATKSLEPYTLPTGELSKRNITDYALPYTIGQEEAEYTPLLKQRQQQLQQNAVINKEKAEVETSGKGTQVGNTIVYKNENGNAATLDLTKYDKIASLPTTNKYDTAVRESKQYAEASKIIDNDELSDEQKQIALNRLGISQPDATYYAVANDNNNLKTLYSLDKINDIMNANGSKQQVLDYLTEGRKEINGKMVVANGVLDNLVDEGVITKAEASAIKQIKLDSKGKKISLSKAKKPKKITFKAPKVLKLKAPKITQIKIKSPKIKRVKAYKRPKIRKLKVKRIKLKKFKA